MGVAVTGIGIVSAAGLTVSENLAMLKSGKSPIRKIEGIQNLRKPYIGGQVSLSDEVLRKELAVSTEKIVPRTALLAMKAASEAWTGHKTSDEIRTAVISATSIGGMELSEQFYRQFKRANDFAKLNWLSVHDNGAGTNILSDFLGINTWRFTVSTACSSAANAILLGARMIQNNVIDRAIVGGADALCNFTLNGFDSLMIYDSEWCKPFDDRRKGLNLGEGAAYLVLESEESRKISGKNSICSVSGWANANDAWHQTASSPEGRGATLAITGALQKAGLTSEKIGYINAHGTATPNNDLSEATALNNVFGNNLPPFSSTKAVTGHTLAAAGAIEAVYSVLAIRDQIIFPNLNFEVPMKEKTCIPVTTLTSAKIDHVLSNSFGFGGNTSSLVFSK